MSEFVIELKNISKQYIGGYLALSEVSLSLECGGRLCVIGEKNSGKSTLLKIIAGLESPSGGNIIFCDGISQNYKERSIGYYTTAEMPNKKSVYDIIAFPLKIRKANNIKAAVESIAAKLHIENLLRSKIKDLNAMQRISVALARLFVIDRQLYLLDNPLENLSTSDRAVMATEIKELLCQVSGAVLMTTDSVMEASNFGYKNNAVLAYSVLSEVDRLWKLRQYPPNLAVARILDPTASVLTLKSVLSMHQASNLPFTMPPTIGEFKNVCLLLYADDGIIGTGVLNGVVSDIIHALDRILYVIDIGNEQITIADYNLQDVNYNVGEKLSFSIKNIRPFDLLSEQSILKRN